MVKKIGLILIAILIASTCVYAQGNKRIPFFPNPQLGGLNTSVSPLILDAKNLTKADNVLYDQIGTRIKRGGMLYLNESSMAPTESSGSNTVMGIYDYRKLAADGAATRKLIAHADGKVYKMDDFDGTWDDISSGALPLTVDVPVDYAILRKADTTVDTLIMVNGQETPQTWNQSDTTISELSGTPSGVDFYPSVIEFHNSRLFVSGVPSYPYRVYYSAAYKHDDWNTVDDAGYVDIIDSFGSKVVGLKGGYFGYLLVFSEQSISRISGSSILDFSTNALFEIGAVSNASIVRAGNDIYWVSEKGIHSLSTTEKYGDILGAYISAPIQKDFNALNKSRLKYCCGQSWEELNYIIWSFSEGGQTTNNICFVYDYLGDRWSKWTGVNASSFAIVYNSSGTRELVAGDYDGFVQRLNRTDHSDNGIAYSFTIRTPHINLGDFILSKNFEELFMFMRPQGNSTLDVIYSIENQTSEMLEISQKGTSAVLGSFVLGIDKLGGGSLVPRSRSMKGTGKTIQLTIAQDGINEESEIYGFAIECTEADIDYSN